MTKYMPDNIINQIKGQQSAWGLNLKIKNFPACLIAKGGKKCMFPPTCQFFSVC